MRWSEKAFQARVRAHCKRLGITLTALLKRADVTEDYLRHPPEVGRNIAGIFKIAEALDINPAELMGLELSNEERRSVTMVAHIMAHLHFNGATAAKDATGIEEIVAAVMAAMKQYDAAPTPAENPTPAAKPARPKRQG